MYRSFSLSSGMRRANLWPMMFEGFSIANSSMVLWTLVTTTLYRGPFYAASIREADSVWPTPLLSRRLHEIAFDGAVKPLRGTMNERTPRPERMVMRLVAVQQIRQRGKRQIVYPRTVSTRHAMFSLQNLGCFVLWIRRTVEECRGQEQEAFGRLPLISAPRHGPVLSAVNPKSGGFLREFR